MMRISTSQLQIRRRTFLPMLALLAAAAVWLLNPQPVVAQYGEGPFGECRFGQECETEPAPDETPEAEIEDESQVLVEVDGDDDGNDEQFVDEDGDNFPDTYTDPDSNDSTPVVVDQDDDGNEVWLFDSDGDGELDSYYYPATGEIGRLPFEQDPIEAEREADPPASPTAQPTSGRALTSTVFGGELYEGIGDQLRKLPQPVARSFPFLLLFVVGLAAARFLAQERGEYKRSKQLLAFYERQKQLFAEKNSFIMLVSHYLRTPLTKIKAGAELMASKFTESQPVKAVMAEANSLNMSVDEVVSDIEDDQQLRQIQNTTTSSAQVLARSAPRFVVPMILFILFALSLRFMLVDFRIIDSSWFELAAEIILGILVIQWFYSALRKRQIARQNRLEQQELVDKQQAIDDSRRQVIAAGSQTIKSSLNDLSGVLPQVTDKPQHATISNGVDQLDSVVARFNLLGGLDSSKIVAQADVFSLADTVQSVVDSYSAQITAKQLAVTMDAVELPSVNQHQSLLQFVLSSVISNAVKYSPQEGTINIQGQIGSDSVTVSVTDNGPGIAEDKLQSLFKPFYRAEDAEQFNQEGLGFNLYLSRVIMRHLGGDISLSSQTGQGTTVKLDIPLSINQAQTTGE